MQPRRHPRAVDALHLATALIFHEALGDVHILSFDERIRANTVALGLSVEPAI